MIPIRSFLSQPEAEIAKSLLESCGIDAMILSDNAGTHLLGAPNVKLLVRETDAEAAEKILAQDMSKA